MAADSGEVFFPGESSNREFPFFARPAEVASPATLVLSLQTAISAAPERSKMRVFVNDVDVGSVDLRSGEGRRIELPIASGVIQPGYNSVSVLVDQKHRVDCSIDATYELWTQIDPENSGFIFTGASQPSQGTVADLIAQGRGNDGRAKLVAHTLPGASATDIDRTMSVIQALSILGDLDHPDVTFDTTASGPGIDIYVGTYGTVRELLNVDATSADVAEGVSIGAPKERGRSRLVISARTADDLELQIKEFGAQAQARDITGTPQGLRALANTKGQLLQPTSQVTLKNLGFISKPFAGRLYRETINFSMPSDFYPADYASLGLNLNAQYAAGLSRDAVLIVKANGQIVSNIQLGDGQTGVIKDQRLPIPLSKLRPGENTLTFEAQLPTAGDVSCNPVADQQDAPRFLILDDTYLDVPAFARVGRYPDIAALVSGSNYTSIQEARKPLSVFVPKLDQKVLDAAGSFIAKMAYSSGQIADMRITAVEPDPTTSAVLAFGTYTSLPQSLQAEMNIDFNNIAVNAFKPALAEKTDPKDGPNELQIPHQSETGSFGTIGGLIQTSKNIGLSAVDWAKQRGQMSFAGLNFGSSMSSRSIEQVYRPVQGSDLLIAQRKTKAGGVWTVVASPNTDVMSASLSALSQRATWRRLNGATQAFSQNGTLIDQQQAAHETLFQTQPPTFTNLRLVTAGWFANNTFEYTIAQIGAALLLGISTFVMLKVGRKS
ncbi:cellulose biosynthesis cyclic di-GMP-binding regulatory protein BcsB [Rhizobium herbae]